MPAWHSVAPVKTVASAWALDYFSDIRILFGDADAMHTQTLIDLLTTDETLESPRLDADAPWGDLRGKPLSKRGLASMLRPFEVKPQKVTINAVSLQGYRRDSLWDAWERYLPSLDSGQAELTEFAESNEQNSRSIVPEVPGIPCKRPPERVRAPSDNSGTTVTNETRDGDSRDKKGDDGRVTLTI